MAGVSHVLKAISNSLILMEILSLAKNVHLVQTAGER
jgi:hypothetical protein